MSLSFPNEPSDYREARERLLAAEIELRAKVEDVARMRRGLPPGGPVAEDYGFSTPEGDAVRLSELFTGPDRALIVYSYMFGPDDAQPCPMCSSILDSLDGTAPHVAQRADLIVVISGTPEQAAGVRTTRGWRNLRLLADAAAYNRAYHGEQDGRQMPMLNVFDRTDGTVRHRWGSELLYAEVEGHPRHVDQVWPLWNLLDLTPEGRGTDWYPQLDYG